MRKLYYSFFSLLLWQALPVSGQTFTTSVGNRYWASAGAGIYSSLDSTGGVYANLNTNWWQGKNIYSLRYRTGSEFELFGPSPSEYFKEVSALIGRGYADKEGIFQVWASTGVGITWGNFRKDTYTTTYSSNWFWDSRTYDSKQYTTICVPVEASVMLTKLKYVGIGFSLNGKLNMYRPNFGYSLNVAVGKLR